MTDAHARAGTGKSEEMDATADAISDSAEGLRDEPYEAEVIHSDLVFHGKVWDVRSDTIRYQGDELVRQYVDHPGAAIIVAVDENERVLLIQQYRHPLRLRDWELPAGLLDQHGEPPLDTAKRELAEEVDFDAASWQPLISVYTTPGGNDEIVHIFLARELTARREAFAREAEEADIRIEWMPMADAVAGVLAGRLRNGILALGVLAASERLRRRTD